MGLEQVKSGVSQIFVPPAQKNASDQSDKQEKRDARAINQEVMPMIVIHIFGHSLLSVSHVND
jgi:hypothetical protein